MQPDGNLVLVSLRTGAVTWSSHTNGHSGAWATMQPDGNFVIYDTNHNALWSSVTWGNNGAYLALQDDGNLVVYKSSQNPNQNPLWSTSTWNGTDNATANGNGVTLTWDAEGKLASQTQAGQTTTYLYDADGNLLLRRSPDKTTVILGDTNDELTYTQATKTLTGTRYYSMPGGVSMVRTATANTYEIADQHGTNTLSLDATSLFQTRNPVDPFGNPRATNTDTSNWAGDRGFVGGVKDTTTGLTNLGAREYQPSTGRFLSADPILSTTDPQQRNGYAYSNNAPVNLEDPTGLKAWDPDTGTEAGIASKLQDSVNTIRSNPNFVESAPALDDDTRPQPQSQPQYSNEKCGFECHASLVKPDSVRKWLAPSKKYGEEADVDPALLLAFAMKETSGKMEYVGEESYSYQSWELAGIVGTKLKVWPNGGASLGVTNVKPDIFGTVRKNFPDQFGGEKWSDLSLDDSLAIKVTAYYVKYLRAKYIQSAPVKISRDYSPAQIAEGLYNAGESNYRGSVVPNGQFGPRATDYIESMTGWVGQAQAIFRGYEDDNRGVNS
ncbi:RHS repeat-associated core domain-containing protein [Kitasatospora sp. NPDC008050]|uniref:RHS repeat-associated core domain-containing protein n=1 Tax=Kitasatospora sp. NPDC008050 TaxID=3364021 RepID=UPI0036E55326